MPTNEKPTALIACALAAVLGAVTCANAADATPAPTDARSSSQAANTSDISVDVFRATDEHPRNTEGSIIELDSGSLLFAVTEFVGGASDFAAARIIARKSDDGGRTWGPKRVLQENVGGQNVMSVTLRRLSHDESAPIGMFYLVKNDYDDLRVYLRKSHYDCHTFDNPILVTDAPGYHVLNNDRVTVLQSGRILVPVATTADVRTENHFVSLCWISDDGGETWRAGKQAVDLPKRGAMEPEVVELADARVLMIMRTQMGEIATAHSEDGGDTWGKPGKLSVQAPEAPSTLRRIPSTDDLLLLWNNTYDAGAGHGGKRTPLTAAVSNDEGKTWKHIRNLEDRDDRTYSYPSLIFVGDRAVMSYWVNPVGSRLYSTRFRSLPVEWFYGQ